MDGYLDLKNAIVQQAAEDYAAAFMGNMVDRKHPQKTLRECEEFFYSDWYTTLTNGEIDGDWLMQNLKIRELERAVAAYETILSAGSNVTFKATVQFPTKKGEEKQAPMNYIIPPKLIVGIMDALKKELDGIKMELAELKEACK